MPEKRNARFRIRLIIVSHFIVTFLIGCDSRQVSNNGEVDTCQIHNTDVDLIIFERDKANDSLLYEQIKNCQDLPKVVELKLDLLIELKRFEMGRKYLKTLKRENFNNAYDSLIYRTFFESKLTENKEAKVEMYKSVTKELEKYLIDAPLDTLALGNFCLYSLEYNNSEHVFDKIDSMAFANNYDPTYAFVISIYLPDQFSNYKQRVRL